MPSCPKNRRSSAKLYLWNVVWPNQTSCSGNKKESVSGRHRKQTSLFPRVQGQSEEARLPVLALVPPAVGPARRKLCDRVTGCSPLTLQVLQACTDCLWVSTAVLGHGSEQGETCHPKAHTRHLGHSRAGVVMKERKSLAAAITDSIMQSHSMGGLCSLGCPHCQPQPSLYPRVRCTELG